MAQKELCYPIYTLSFRTVNHIKSYLLTYLVFSSFLLSNLRYIFYLIPNPSPLQENNVTELKRLTLVSNYSSEPVSISVFVFYFFYVQFHLWKPPSHSTFDCLKSLTSIFLFPSNISSSPSSKSM